MGFGVSQSFLDAEWLELAKLAGPWCFGRCRPKN